MYYDDAQDKPKIFQENVAIYNRTRRYTEQHRGRLNYQTPITLSVLFTLYESNVLGALSGHGAF